MTTSLKNSPERMLQGKSALTLIVFSLLVTGAALAQNPVPFINAPLVPGNKAPGSSAFTLTVNGTGFVSGAAVYWNGSSRTTTFVSASQLTASINAADVATAQSVNVTVVNPAPGGGSSNVAPFQVIKNGYTTDFSHIDYATGNTPQAIVSGDFNRDGKLDLITCNGDNTLSYLKGNGDGSFQTPVSISATGHPVAIIAADFNGDGKLDLATADQYIAAITVFLGNGDGTFQGGVLYNTGNQPVALAAADFNKDGKLDIITADYSDNQVGVLLGNGDGTFQTFKSYSTGNGPTGVAVGDFNLDGKLDVAVPNTSDSTVAVLLGNGDGTFGSPITFATSINPNSVVTGDFNADGLLDLAVGTSNKSISVLIGNGNGTFQNYKNYTIGANSALVAAADLASTGKLSLIAANFGDNTVSTLVGNGDGTFKSQGVIPVGLGPIGVAPGDFDNSGKMDIAVANSNGNTVSILTSSLVTVSPGLLSYGTQTSGFPSPTKTVTLQNNGTSAYTIGTISIVGAFPTDFTQTNTCGTSLAAGATCTFTVTFTPTASESANAQLLMTQSGGSILGFQMTGTGNIPITLNPRNVTFSFQVINTTSKDKSVTFTNKSGVNINFSNIDLEGVNQTEFAIDWAASTCSLTSPLLPSASCTLSFNFTPTQVGGATVTLVFYGNFTQAKQGTLINGQGTAVSYTPKSLTWGKNKAGTCSSTLKTVTFNNVGSTSLSITSVTFTGLNNDWTQTNTCQPSVPANSSCTFTVTFCPGGTGARSAQMNIGDADPSGPQVVTLSGTGD
jgi:hypothetical protein